MPFGSVDAVTVVAIGATWWCRRRHRHCSSLGGVDVPRCAAPLGSVDAVIAVALVQVVVSTVPLQMLVPLGGVESVTADADATWCVESALLLMMPLGSEVRPCCSWC